MTKAGADYIHVDVMDGYLVPNTTIGAPVVAPLRSWTNLPSDVHLMIERAEGHISQLAEAGAEVLVAGSANFDSKQKVGKALHEMRKALGLAS